MKVMVLLHPEMTTAAGSRLRRESGMKSTWRGRRQWYEGGGKVAKLAQ